MVKGGWLGFLLVAGLAGCGGAEKPAEAEFRLISGDAIFAMVVPPSTPRERLPALAKAHCGARSFCKVLAWTDPGKAATAFPMTDAEQESLAFSYSINRPTGFEQSLWSCRAYPDGTGDDCL